MVGSHNDLPAQSLRTALDRSASRVSSAFAEQLELIAEFNEQQLWAEDGATSMSAWIAARYGVARSTAHEWVRVANAIRSLPAIARAHGEGRLSFDQVKPLTRFVTEDEDDLWAERAFDMSPAKLWTEAHRRQKRTRDEARTDSDCRSLHMQWDEDRRTLHVEADLPGEQGVVFETTINRAAQDVVLEPGPLLDPEGARYADALVGLLSSSAGGSGDPILVIHADAAVLAEVPEGERPRLAETESEVRLAEDTVRRLACDATIEWVLESEGVPVGIGRRSRSIPLSLLRLLRHRDQACRFPGCEHRRWLKAHHIHHWGRGGPTDLDNLVLLCHAHHRLIHEGGWTIRGHPAGKLRFHDPGGRVAPQRASPDGSAEVAA